MSKEEDPSDEEGLMPWEWQSHGAVEGAMRDVTRDEVRGVIYLQTGHDKHLNPIEEEFASADEVRQRLTDIGENAWSDHVPYDGGEPVWAPDVDDVVEAMIAKHGLEDFFDRIAPPKNADELATARALSIPRSGLILQADLTDINEELIRYLARHPESLRSISPRKYEELVAEIFKDKGYQVELTPKSKDGGFDIRAFQRSDVGTCLTIIECKRYTERKPVSVEIVRGLYGVTVNEGATRGIVATTSRFTRGAKSFQAKNKFKLHLADFEDMKSWLNGYKRKIGT